MMIFQTVQELSRRQTDRHTHTVKQTLLKTIPPSLLCRCAAGEYRSRDDAKQSKAYLFVKYDWLPKKPSAQQCWQPIVTAQTVKISSHKEQKTYILATPHRHNITVIDAKEQQ